MDGKVQTSFIPRKPLVPSQGVVSRSTSLNIFGIFGIIVFIVSIAAAGGVFAWTKVLEKHIADNKDVLQKTRQQFDASFIDEAQRLSNKITTAKYLLNNHVAVSALLSLFQDITLKTVRFRGLTYVVEPKDLKISMKGQAQNFAALALQADAFANDKDIGDPTLGNLTLDENGNVSFDFTGTVLPTTVLYRTLIPGAATTTENVVLPVITPPNNAAPVLRGT